MKMHLLPDKLLIARYNDISGRLNTLPKISMSQDIIRIKIKDNERYRYKRVFPRSPKRSEYEELLKERILLESHRRELENAWKIKHNSALSSTCIEFAVNQPSNPFLQIETYNSLAEYSNTHPIETDYTLDGRPFRSRLELMTAEALKDLGLEWKYEPMIKLNIPGRYQGDSKTVNICPDFAVPVPELQRVFLIECLGMLSESSYINDAFDKLKIYCYNNIYPSKDLVLIPGNKDYIPSEDSIIASIAATLDHMCSESLKLPATPLTSAGSLTI